MTKTIKISKRAITVKSVFHFSRTVRKDRMTKHNVAHNQPGLMTWTQTKRYDKIWSPSRVTNHAKHG